MAVLAPMPSPSAITPTAVKAGFFLSIRAPYFKSCVRALTFYSGLPSCTVGCRGGLAGETSRCSGGRHAAFFSKVKLYRPYGDLVDEFVLSNEGKGYYDTSSHSVARIQRYKADVKPTFILTGEHPEPGEDPRVAFARMLTNNIQFARATVNLFWSELFGVGIVDPPTGFDLARYDAPT